MTSLSEAFCACEDVTRERAGNFYHAFRLLDERPRRDLCAAYAFFRYVDDIVDEPGDEAAKRRALDAVRRALDTCLAGRSVEDGGPARKLFTALGDVVGRCGIDLVELGAVVDGAEQDLTVRRYATFAQLEDYCYKVAGSVGLVTIAILGCRDECARGPARDLGTAMQLTNILRDVREDAARDRIYLPAEDLERFRVAEGDLSRGVGGEGFEALVRFEAARARRCFESGRLLDGWLAPAAAVVPRALAALYGAILERIEAEPGRVLVERVSLGAIEKGLIAARALLGGERS